MIAVLLTFFVRRYQPMRKRGDKIQYIVRVKYDAKGPWGFCEQFSLKCILSGVKSPIMATTYVKENKCGAPKADACPINSKFCRPNGSWVNGLANTLWYRTPVWAWRKNWYAFPVQPLPQNLISKVLLILCKTRAIALSAKKINQVAINNGWLSVFDLVDWFLSTGFLVAYIKRTIRRIALFFNAENSEDWNIF